MAVRTQYMAMYALLISGKSAFPGVRASQRTDSPTPTGVFAVSPGPNAAYAEKCIVVHRATPRVPADAPARSLQLYLAVPTYTISLAMGFCKLYLRPLDKDYYE